MGTSARNKKIYSILSGASFAIIGFVFFSPLFGVNIFGVFPNEGALAFIPLLIFVFLTLGIIFLILALRVKAGEEVGSPGSAQTRRFKPRYLIYAAPIVFLLSPFLATMVGGRLSSLINILFKAASVVLLVIGIILSLI